MNAFLTGSYAYGKPSEASDIDLCVMLSNRDANVLAQLSDTDPGSTPSSLRFGKLNLIILDPKDFVAWRRSTAELVGRKPVTREEAVSVIKQEMKDERKSPRYAAYEG